MFPGQVGYKIEKHQDAIHIILIQNDDKEQSKCIYFTFCAKGHSVHPFQSVLSFW